jgi:hypothetical protein
MQMPLLFSAVLQPSGAELFLFSWWLVLVLALLLVGYVLWRRYRSRRRLMQQVEELVKLSEAGRAIVAAQLNLDELVALIAQEVGTVIDNRTFQIGLFEGMLYHIIYWTINGEVQKQQTFDLSENMGVVGWVRQEKKPLLVHDFLREMDTLPGAAALHQPFSPPLRHLYPPHQWRSGHWHYGRPE